MAIEICVKCGIESTPWEWIPELNGHMCCDCSYKQAEEADMTDQKDIGSKAIYDREGRLIGNITGRKGEIERFSNNDLAKQLERDREKHRDNLRR